MSKEDIKSFKICISLLMVIGLTMSAISLFAIACLTTGVVMLLSVFGSVVLLNTAVIAVAIINLEYPPTDDFNDPKYDFKYEEKPQRKLQVITVKPKRR